MEKIIDMHLEFFKELKTNNSVLKELEKENVKILQGFIENVHLVRQFYEKYYANNNEKRIVLCGINPGKDGAGKTGIPFIDFKGASKLLSNISKDKGEKSAQFIFSVIEEKGVKEFFKNVYLTNVSWFGFLKDNKNHNYFKFPPVLQRFFTNNFIKEMNIVKPLAIVPLSEEVEKTLKEMRKANLFPYKLAERLPHPVWCSYKSRAIPYKKKYLSTIENLIKQNEISKVQ